MKQYFSLNKEIHPGRDGELLCDQDGDGVKPLSGAGQECANQCSIDQDLRAYGSNWLKTVPSPSDWCKIDNISDLPGIET